MCEVIQYIAFFAHSMKTFRIAVFASGYGSNAGAIFEYFKHHPSIEVVLLLSNDPGAGALNRARAAGIEARSFDYEQISQGNVFHWLEEFEVTHIVLAGYLKLVPTSILRAFPDRIINIHPALLPKFGGKGMYGMRVHESVKRAGDRETGITIHLVNEKYDEGKILSQVSCPVDINDEPEQIAARVRQLEHNNYPRVIEEWILSGLGKR